MTHYRHIVASALGIMLIMGCAAKEHRLHVSPPTIPLSVDDDFFDHEESCDLCSRGGAGENLWCDQCGVGFVGGEKVTCEPCFEGLVEGNAAPCDACVKDHRSGGACTEQDC